METAEVSSCTKDDDITTCTICLEQLNIPKYLPCLHTFCEVCIGIYITSAFEKDNTCINCPVCRTKVPAPELSIPPEQWAKRLPLNFLLVGLIEKHKVERPGKICMSCERIDVNKKSEAVSVCIDCSDTLCSVCLNCHRINKSSSNHEIVDILRQGIVLKSFKNMCTEHKSKDLELFCADHNLPCCAICVSVTHRMCVNVLTIEDAAKKFRETTSVDKVKNDVSTLLADIAIVVQLERESLKNLEADKIYQLKTYNDFWTNVQKQVDEMKKNQTKQYQMFFDEEKSDLESSINDLENKMKTVANTRKILEVTVNEASNVQVMIEVQRVKKQIDLHLLTLKRIQRIKKIDFQFVNNLDEVDKMLENVCNLNCNKKSMTLDLTSFKAETCSANSGSSNSDSEIGSEKFNISSSYCRTKKLGQKRKQKNKAKKEKAGRDRYNADHKPFSSQTTGTDTYQISESYEPQTSETYEGRITEADKPQVIKTHVEKITETHAPEATRAYGEKTTENYTPQATKAYAGQITEHRGPTVSRLYGGPVKVTHEPQASQEYGVQIVEQRGPTVSRTYGGPVKVTHEPQTSQEYGVQRGPTLSRLYGGTTTQTQERTVSTAYGGQLQNYSYCRQQKPTEDR